MHIGLDHALVAQLDELTGPQGRTGFVRSAIEEAVRAQLRWSDIEAAAGAIDDSGHPWDADPGAWVRDQRGADARRTG